MKRYGIFVMLILSVLVLGACAPEDPTGAAVAPGESPQDAPADSPDPVGGQQGVDPTAGQQPQQIEQPEITQEELDEIMRIEQEFIEEHGEEAAREMTPEEIRELFESEGVDPEVVDMIVPPQ